MCLVRSNMNCGPKYAVEDKICYKILCKELWYDRYYSPYKFFEYELNKLVSANFSFTLSLPIISPQQEYNCLKRLRNFTYIRQGLHSFEYLPDAISYNKMFRKGIVMKCIIPKGSWYYEGRDGDLVSDNIIVIKEIND